MSNSELYKGCELIWQQLKKRSRMLQLVISVYTFYVSCCTAFEDFWISTYCISWPSNTTEDVVLISSGLVLCPFAASNTYSYLTVDRTTCVLCSFALDIMEAPVPSNPKKPTLTSVMF